MFWQVLMVSAIVATTQVPAPKRDRQPSSPNPTHGIAEQATLRDGAKVLGVVTSVTAGTNGVVEMLVRREWARIYQAVKARKWERSLENPTRLGIKQRRDRLAAWLRERSAGRPDDRRTLDRIDAERQRLEDPARVQDSALLWVRIPRGEVRSLVRQSPENIRLLQLGWLCALKDVENMPLESLKVAIESRGYSVEGQKTPALDALLPLLPEADIAWQARRAATELVIDSDLRFVQHQNMVKPDAQSMQGVESIGGELGLSTALGELSRLLDPDTSREDPLIAVLKTIGDSGRVGAMVTRLELAPDLSRTTVESTLWVRAGPERWVPFVKRSSSVRPEEIAVDEGRDILEDPRVKSAFAVVEGLGLGKVTPELKDRSLKMGAATRKALGDARSAIGEDLDRLMLPFFRSDGVDVNSIRDRPVDKPPDRGNDAKAATPRRVVEKGPSPAP